MEIVWKSFIGGNLKLTPDELKSAYTNLIDALSYSRTFYPLSKTTLYLNDLALKGTFKGLHKGKFDISDFKRFWVKELRLLCMSQEKTFDFIYLDFCDWDAYRSDFNKI